MKLFLAPRWKRWLVEEASTHRVAGDFHLISMISMTVLASAVSGISDSSHYLVQHHQELKPQVFHKDDGESHLWKHGIGQGSQLNCFLCKMLATSFAVNLIFPIQASLFRNLLEGMLC